VREPIAVPVRRLSWSISIHFVAIYFFAAKNCQKVIKKPIFLGLKVVKVIDVDIPQKLVASACYDKQHVCAYLQLFSR